ncbi:MAG: D-alanyl-D-alanine carboxypeptidase [Deltaproteobacteria bacterium]|nr:D-alanyl-D-alanine carboxypeptidase [Deltaproteobacteria bacterium]
MRIHVPLPIIICLTVMLITGSAVAGSNEDNFSINAKAAALFEVASEQFLLEQNADEKIAPASFTKVMTLFLVEDFLRDGVISLADEVPVSKKAWRTAGSKMFIEVDTRVRLEDLLKGIAVVSGNDACVAVAEHLVGKEEAFVEQMNKKAIALGLTNTKFQTPHGLPADDGDQYTTARDMTVLAHHYISEYPHVLDIHSLREFTYNNITQPNRNRLLWRDAGVDGLKTGHIETAGYHLVATAEQEGRRLIAVVMGAESWDDRENEALKLLNFGFRSFVIKDIIQKSATVKAVPVKGGKYNTIELVAEDGITVSVLRNDAESLTVTENIPTPIVAPVRKGDLLGNIVVAAGEKKLHQINLVAKNDVPKGWQAYWQYGAVLLAALALIYLLYRIGTRRKSSSNLEFTDQR